MSGSPLAWSLKFEGQVTRDKRDKSQRVQTVGDGVAVPWHNVKFPELHIASPKLERSLFDREAKHESLTLNLEYAPNYSVVDGRPVQPLDFGKISDGPPGGFRKKKTTVEFLSKTNPDYNVKYRRSASPTFKSQITREQRAKPCSRHLPENHQPSDLRILHVKYDILDIPPKVHTISPLRKNKRREAKREPLHKSATDARRSESPTSPTDAASFEEAKEQSQDLAGTKEALSSPAPSSPEGHMPPIQSPVHRYSTGVDGFDVSPPSYHLFPKRIQGMVSMGKQLARDVMPRSRFVAHEFSESHRAVLYSASPSRSKETE